MLQKQPFGSTYRIYRYLQKHWEYWERFWFCLANRSLDHPIIPHFPLKKKKKTVLRPGHGLLKGQFVNNPKTFKFLEHCTGTGVKHKTHVALLKRFSHNVTLHRAVSVRLSNHLYDVCEEQGLHLKRKNNLKCKIWPKTPQDFLKNVLSLNK